MYSSDIISYNSTDVGISLCCNYGLGRVYLPSVEYLLYRKDSERTYFITHGTGDIVHFNSSYCRGFNFTLLLVRIDNNFIRSVQPMINCSDPSYGDNVLTVNVTNIKNRGSSSSDQSDNRYIIFRDYNVENSNIIITFVKLYIFDRSTFDDDDDVTITRCINTDTGYRVPIYNPITLNCDDDNDDCVFEWRISNFIYYTFIYYQGGPSDINCALKFNL